MWKVVKEQDRAWLQKHEIWLLQQKQRREEAARLKRRERHRLNCHHENTRIVNVYQRLQLLITNQRYRSNWREEQKMRLQKQFDHRRRELATPPDKVQPEQQRQVQERRHMLTLHAVRHRQRAEQKAKLGRLDAMRDEQERYLQHVDHVMHEHRTLHPHVELERKEKHVLRSRRFEKQEEHEARKP